MKIKPFKLERFFAKYEFKAPYLLCSSDCESISVADLLELEPGAEEGLKDLWLGYTESQGDPNLREEIAKLYPGIKAEHVLIHAGAEEAIFNTMNALLAPGDHVIVQFPCYQSLAEIAETIGCDVTYWKLENGPDWQLDFDFLREQITPKTKLVIVNTPHNPTGYQLSSEDFQQLSDLSNQYGFHLFSDEVYRYLEYAEKDRLPSICEINENGIALGVMSKAYGLAGLRIGWIVTRNRDVYEKLASYKDYTSICNSAPSEYLSLIALKHGQQLVNRNLAIIKNNLTLLQSFFEEHRDLFSWKAPLAGPIAFPTLKMGNINTFCDDLVSRAGVLLLPGTLYDTSSNNFRIGFGRTNMPEALKRLDAFIKG